MSAATEARSAAPKIQYGAAAPNAANASPARIGPIGRLML
jgi:hypothetical protein